MGLFSWLTEKLDFDGRDTSFVLRERETGEPSMFGAWRDIPPERGDQPEGLFPKLDDNIAHIREAFRADINSDLIVRDFVVGSARAALVFINGMSDTVQLCDFILREGMRAGQTPGDALKYISENVFSVNEIESVYLWSALRTAVLDGKSAVFVDGETGALVMDTRGYERRSVEPPENEKVVRGPKESFNENLRTNITLIRRIIRNEDLVCEFRRSGGENRLNLGIMYREGVADPDLVLEVKRRLDRISARTVMGAGMLEQYIEDRRFMPLPQVLCTVRPDRAASFLMQGHVAVLLDGSPYANIMPVTLFSLMSTSEDVYLRQPAGTLLRTVRYLGALLSLFLPGYFLAMALHHQGLMSTEVLSTVIASRSMVFEPIATEMIMLLLVFQLVREAGIRVPGTIGQAIGIIGGLILGQAAVAANLASSVVLIVVALTGLGNFCIPDYSVQITAGYIRLAILLVAWMGGLLGMSALVLCLFAYLASVRSFGVPFLAPFAPKTASKRPVLFRGPLGGSRRATDYMNTAEDKRL